MRERTIMPTNLGGAARLALLPLALLALGASCAPAPDAECTDGPICETRATGERYVVPRCVPAWNDGPVPADCGVFVSTSLGDDEGAGSQDKPFRTLAHAILIAGADRPIYVCAEDFSERLVLPAGASLFGGLDCQEGYRWKDTTQKTRLYGLPDEIPLVLAPGSHVSRIEDFAVFAADATRPGGSSIALLADHTRAELRRCDVRAGAGADGEDGAALPYDSALDGFDGEVGQAVCVAAPELGTPGGTRVERMCEDGNVSMGGRGGDGGAIPPGSSQSTPGKAGEIGAPAVASFGLGGAGDAGWGWSCTTGKGTPGNDGARGTPGTGAAGFGRLDATGYFGIAGGTGGLGLPGQGGGGAGGARGAASICANATPGAGASGGSGGSGGCGGKGGKGGGPGGASIGIASVESSIALWDGRVASDRGGKGGKGADGQPGGAGGMGGKGGTGKGLSAPDACQGGAGGMGGKGGPGGGGLGGPAFVIVHVGGEPELRGAVSLATGKPGDGGLGGDGDVAGNRGAPGIGAAIRGF
ncbi:PGRS family protein [Polyangium sp. 6x1]|uniref:PGRS family protein n=1 Tax=Polyangium sp. 6x1 TaxID=3042689 RepID=UPI0024828153|nr:PGRS family protein [Polyangium sp. 6x1]MDI1445700.1 PGRS family protein [Polyangium sp. 6x1]